MTSRAITCAIATAVLALGGCGGSDAPSSEPTKTKSPKWSKSYINTTCEQWIDDMSQAQNRAAAETFLTNAWSTEGVFDREPPAKLVDRFKSEMSDICNEDPSIGIPSAAAQVYLSEKAAFKP